MRLCSANTKAGKPCPSPAVTGKPFCTMHSGRARDLGRRGGLRRTVFNPDGLTELGIPTNAHDLAWFIATCMDEVRKSKLAPTIANCLGQLGMVFLKAIEQVPDEKTDVLGELLAEYRRRYEHLAHGQDA